LLGVRPPSEIARLHRASDLFALSSAYEGMPIAVLEALACGIPVVSTDVGEIRRVVTNGVNGMVATERTAAALAAAITTTIEAGDAMRGDACTRAIAAFRPANVLNRIYENHRSQSPLPASHARVCHG
jgi:glycosyltransferase involved in cell wall biosynthesis